MGRALGLEFCDTLKMSLWVANEPEREGGRFQLAFHSGWLWAVFRLPGLDNLASETAHADGQSLRK